MLKKISNAENTQTLNMQIYATFLEQSSSQVISGRVIIDVLGDETLMRMKWNVSICFIKYSIPSKSNHSHALAGNDPNNPYGHCIPYGTILVIGLLCHSSYRK